MKSHEKPARQFPHVIKVGNAVVKIYRGKTRGYDLFTVVHYRDGKRHRDTFSKFENARIHAQEVATQIARGRVNVLALTAADRDGYVAALNLLKPLGIPLHAAGEDYVRAVETLGGCASLIPAVEDFVARKTALPKKPVSQVVEEFLARGEMSDRYKETIRSHLNRFAGAFHTEISSVSPALVEQWLRGLGVGNRTQKNIRGSVTTLFRFAEGKLRERNKRDGKIQIFTPEQMAEIMAHAAPKHALYFALAAFTGIRSAELIRLEWQDINFKRSHITVAAEKAKTASRRLVPIQPNLMQWLTPHRKSSGKLFVSRRLADEAIAAVKEREIKWPNNVLRHSYATYRLAATNDAAKVAMEMGNSPAMLYRHYRELADEQDAAAWFAISPKKPGNVVSIAAA